VESRLADLDQLEVPPGAGRSTIFETYAQIGREGLKNGQCRSTPVQMALSHRLAAAFGDLHVNSALESVREINQGD
jgi:hypothetical protein